MTAQANCPCGSGSVYLNCCAPYHQGTPAPTAEALMRSRYSAFVLELEDYLLATWHSDERPNEVAFDENCKWLGLKIKRTEQGKPDDDNGLVEFVARYRIDGKGYRLTENSLFKKIDGRWYYHSAQSLVTN